VKVEGRIHLGLPLKKEEDKLKTLVLS